ncbi:WD40 repeat domain-containing serine/threonine protein kinase [Nocardia australiensis]|uniref:WD40 repeat domain-containing serine/threonine protein kinase n=1 Tax=Nocardia australiensis TaxID=2887191 RepID=UPI001D1580E5|nr:serine/threonine-protein kinase [Nocardia australiensis]
MVLATGDVFAGFMIEEVLGAGGMGVVYAARHPRMDRLVALKVLNDNLATDRRAHAAFDREAELAARLDHPNIVTVHDRSAPGDPVLWLAMRRIRGGDAASFVAAHPDGLAPRLAAELITDAAAALDYAHAQGVLHRDVKPANLLIEADARHGQRALLTDFGIARTLDSTVTLSAISASFAYAAPERFAQAPADPSADIYSLGATLFHLLAGRPPFPRADQAAVIGAHLSEPPPAPSRSRTDLPVELDAVIATAMAKNPADRYPTCAALAEAARTASTAQIAHTTPPSRPSPATPKLPVHPPDPSVTSVTRDSADIKAQASAPPVPVPGPRITRRRLLTAAGLVVPLTTATVAGITLTARESSSQEPPNEPPKLKVPRPIDSLPLHLETAVYRVVFSPDSSMLAAATYDKIALLWDARTYEPMGQPLDGHTSVVFSATFNHDGTLLATASGDSTVRFWDPRTQQQVGQHLTDPSGGVNCVAFSPDDTYVATVGDDKATRLWNVGTREQIGESLATAATYAATSMVFSPDGTFLAAADIDSTVRFWDPRTREQIGQPLKGHTDAVVSLAFSRDGTRLATASYDNTVRLWDTHTHQQIGQPFLGHANRAHVVAISPDGTMLATGGGDKTVRVWDAHTHQQIGQPLVSQGQAVYSVAFSPDGNFLASAGEEDFVRMWTMTEPA